MQVGDANGGAFTFAPDVPVRSFSVRGNLTPAASLPEISSQLYLLNITKLNAAVYGSTPTNDIPNGPFTFYMQQGNPDGRMDFKEEISKDAVAISVLMRKIAANEVQITDLRSKIDECQRLHRSARARGNISSHLTTANG